MFNDFINAKILSFKVNYQKIYNKIYSIIFLKYHELLFFCELTLIYLIIFI